MASPEANPGPSSPSFATTGRSRLGEPLVWLTAAGLAIGVLMAVGLLAVITVNGVRSFWPHEIYLMEVEREGKIEKMAGWITQEEVITAEDGSERREVQIFRGNKDLTGESFLYTDRSQLKSMTKPDDYMYVERREYGPAIMQPVSLTTPEGTILADDPAFRPALEDMLSNAEEQRDRLRKIERKEIGANARALEELALDEENGRIGSAQAEEKRAELQAEFQVLSEEAGAIRDKLQESSFLGKIADGSEVTVNASALMGYFSPNKTGFVGQLGEMFHRMWKFLSEDPREANTEGGVFPAIFGTVVMTLAMSLFVTPFGVIAAIYLREYAKQGFLVRAVRVSVNNLAGVPSIVFGVFGLAFFVYYIGAGIDQTFFSEKLPTPTYGTPGILWASLTLAILTLPVMIVATEEALAAVPRGVREAALACGASKWQTIQRVVLPAALPGIMTGVILAMARGAGEVAPLMIVGVVKLAPSLPIDSIPPFIHPERKFMHLGFHIYDLGFQSPDAEAAKPMVYATALLLIAVVVILNLAAIMIRNRLRKKFAVSSF